MHISMNKSRFLTYLALKFPYYILLKEGARRTSLSLAGRSSAAQSIVRMLLLKSAS